MIAWFALILALLELLLLVGVTLFLRRSWRQLAPTIGPLLSMFAPPADQSTTSSSGSSSAGSNNPWPAPPASTAELDRP